MRFGSLFSGIGGFDLGFEQAEMSCSWQVEIDESCQTVLKSHFQAEVFTDVQQVGRNNLTPVDLVCGGFPCQDVSIAGHRKGLAGQRSGLWFEMYRILTEMHPAWVVIENVPGLLHSNGGRDFATVLSGLVKCGYRVAWRVLDAQYFGLAQRRKRVFLVGHLGDGRAAEILFESQSLSGNSETSEKTKSATSEIVGTLSAKGNRYDGESETFVLSGFGLFFPASKTGALRSSGGDNGGGSDALAITVNGVRRLTPIECERLQGFPDGWTEGFSDSTRYRMLGNAVAVPVAQWIGDRITNE
jgi:DNA (cytosine-5)-methyltransferase 1